MFKKRSVQNKILKILRGRTAISSKKIKEKLNPQNSKEKYANTRCLKNLVKNSHIEIINSDTQEYLKITPKGKKKLTSIEIEGEEALISKQWDGYWRIIILNIEENRKNDREGIRYLLKKANFVAIKKAVWISPYPYEHLFINIKKDLGLETELMVIVTNKIDTETQKAFLKALKK